MAHVPVTIDITARDNGASNALENINRRRLDFVNGRYDWVDEPSSGTTTPSGTPGNPTPMNNRMSDDIRREIMQRGVMMVPGSSNFNQLMNTVVQQQRTAAQTEIDDRYNAQRKNLNDAADAAEEAARQEVEKRRLKALEGVTDPAIIQRRNENFDEVLKRAITKARSPFEAQISELSENKKGEEIQVEQELAKTANEIVQELRKRKDSSYLGQLRQEYQEAIWRRDTAETKEGAQEAGAEAAEIQRRMSKAMMPTNRLAQMTGVLSGIGSVINTANNATNAYFQNTAMKIGEINSVANGDVFGAMQQDLERQKMIYSTTGMGVGTIVGGIVGGVVAALGSYGVGTGAGAGIGMAAGGTAGTLLGNLAFNVQHGDDANQVKLGSMWQQQEQRMQQFNDLALITRNFSGQGLEDERITLLNSLGQVFTKGLGLQGYDLGYTFPQLASQLRRRALQRGFIDNTDSYTYLAGMGDLLTQDALERVYNLSEGSLGQYSQFDRYSRGGRHRNNANQSMANLVASLSRLGTIGMSGGQTLRANEFLGYQTQLMEMQKGWMDAPDSNYATRMLLAGQRAFGDNFDSRAITEIGQIENAITHPKEDYSKAILYDVIQNEFEGTRGNLLAIKQKQFSDNPEDRLRLNRAMFNRLTEIYGGVDTTSGYLALSHYTGIEDPNRLRKWVNGITSGIPQVTQGNVASDVEPLKELISPVSKEMLQFQDSSTRKIADSLEKLEGIGTTLINTFREKIDELINDLK